MMKKKQAFTLMEVLIAISILVSTVFVLNDLHIRSMFRVLKDREEIERVFYVKRELYLEYLNPAEAGKRHTAKLENPEITITTQAREFASKSPLGPFKDDMLFIESEGSWQSGQKSRFVRLVTLLRKPIDEEEDKKKKK